jgi:hypothetical protein
MGGNVVLPSQVRTYMDVGRLTNRPQPNEYDQCLQAEKGMWDQIVSGGLDQVCCPQGRPPYALKPYIAMPDSGRRFKEVGSVLVGTNPPLVGDTLVPVLTFTVPTGYDGVVDTVICNVTPGSSGPSGFIEGSGTIVWRVAADSILFATSGPRYLRDLGNIMFSYGSLTTPIPTTNSSLRLYSGNIVTFYADFFSSGLGVLATDATVVCGLSGWFYSR